MVKTPVNLKLTGVFFVFCRFRVLVKYYDGISLTQKSIQNTANTVLLVLGRVLRKRESCF